MDAAAALLSLYAVGVAERPPDARHQYGHGKAQHLGALFEALFLAAFAGWIAIEAVLRLRSGGGDVQAHWYAFVLMGVVLVVDAGRATVSLRTGRSERNAALMASAWHFASDFVGTIAVITGLLLVSAGYPRADSVAALGVAALVLVAAVRLAAQNIDVLMDRAPLGIGGQIEQAVRSVPGVSEVRSVRVREAAGQSFADVVIGVSRLEGLERSHRTMDLVEEAVSIAGGAGPGDRARRAERRRRGAQRARGGGRAAGARRCRGAQHHRARAARVGPRDHPARAAAGGDGDARGRRHRRAAEAGDPVGVRRRPRVRPRRALGAGCAARPRRRRRRAGAGARGRGGGAQRGRRRGPRWWSTGRGGGCWW